jgi:enoyl-CoA hydratase
MSPLVMYQLKDSVATITMDDGKANVMSVQMLGELNAALDRAEADKGVVMLTGREGVFSAGFDLGVIKHGKAKLFNMLKAGAETAERLLSFPAPVVVACGGHAIAMGAFLILAADVRVGILGGPSKICVNEVEIGLTVPRFAIEMCRQRLAPAYFNRAVITAEPCDPRQAVEAGFLDVLVPAPELLSAAHDKATTLSRLVRDALIATKRRAREGVLQALHRAIEADLEDWTPRVRDA